MDSVESGVPTTEDCRQCGLNGSTGLRTIYSDGIIEWKCNACGRKMRVGEMEHSNLKALKAKADRERSQENRDRYRREKFDEVQKNYMHKRKEGEALPSPVELSQAASKILNPSFVETPDPEPDNIIETDQGKFAMKDFTS